MKNKFYNWIHGVKRVRTKGARNCGITRKGNLVRYDWNKPMEWVSRGGAGGGGT